MIDDGPNDAREALARIERGADPREVFRDMLYSALMRDGFTPAEQRILDRWERQHQQRRWLARFCRGWGMN